MGSIFLDIPQADFCEALSQNSHLLTPSNKKTKTWSVDDNGWIFETKLTRLTNLNIIPSQLILKTETWRELIFTRKGGVN